jgi:3',5'-cyclic AMP phosphodiesterase CpdA
MMRIAQISDLHIRRETDKKALHFDRWLTGCIERVNAAAPDIVLVTGDLTDTGDEEEYVRVRRLLNHLQMPYYVMPGNHDDARTLARVFTQEPYRGATDGHFSYAVDAGPVRIVALDSTKYRRPGGYLDEARLSWLRSQLRNARERPVLLALHHPPFPAGVWPMDWLGYESLEELKAIVAANPQIKRIVSGHVHCARTARWAGTFACTSPSTRPQRLIVGVGWRFPKVRFERPGFLIHSLEGQSISTQVHRTDGSIETL